ncbi:MAG TPA: type II secretion protein F [Deltaproteobacteria bacterium]|nr:type II secretion protein F [Deltaproteobacteria bacterium]
MAHETQDTFQKLETKGRHLKTKKSREEEVKAPHLIRLPKGAVPEYIKLTSFQELSWRMMGNYVKSKNAEDQELEENLLKAHMKIRPEEFMATVYMTAVVLFAVALVAGIVIALIFTLFLDMFLIGLLLAVAMPIGLPFMAFNILKGTPGSKAKSRARNIDKRISSAMSFISAMASANVPVDMVFKELSRQPVYGEIQREAEWITRDTELLGIDILTAIKKGALRSPSQKFQDFLQGVVTTSTSGGQLKPYFLLKATEYEKENKLVLKSTMETLSMLGESYVTVVVAFPLFLVVILAIMAIIGGNAANTLMILYAVVGLMIPLAMFGFIFVVWNTGQE